MKKNNKISNVLLIYLIIISIITFLSIQDFLPKNNYDKNVNITKENINKKSF